MNADLEFVLKEVKKFAPLAKERIYPDEGELKRGQSNASQSDLLKGMRYDSKGVWLTEKGFKDRYEAINNLIPRIKLIERSPSF